MTERKVSGLGGALHGRGAAELRQLERAAAQVRHGQRSAARAHATGAAGHVVVALRRETRARVGQPERADDAVAGRFRDAGQQKEEHGPLPAEYEEHEHAAERVDRVRHVPVLRRRLHGPRDHLEHERHAHQTEQLQVQRQPVDSFRCCDNYSLLLLLLIEI